MSKASLALIGILWLAAGRAHASDPLADAAAQAADLTAQGRKLAEVSNETRAGITAATPSISFAVDCDLHGRHGTDIDRVDPAREKQLLEAAIRDTYPDLPPELQDVARQVTFRISHEPERLSKNFSGWSAEDDPDYRYPDKDFYPKGTIKANFTEKFIRALDLGTELGRNDPSAARGIRGYWRVIVSHELRHAWQYHNRPVRDLDSVAGSVQDGLADEDILKETEEKVQYERQAFQTEYPFVRRSKDDMLHLADAIDAYVKARPELFGDSGEYRLLTRGANPFTEYYLRETAAEAETGGDFGPAAKVVYEGQYVPAEIVLELEKLNDRLDASPAGLAAAAPRVEELERQWALFMDGPTAETLRKTYSYVPEVEKRYQIEIGRYQRQARQEK